LSQGAIVEWMAFCSNCGTKLNDGAKYCPKCGIATDSHIVYAQSPQQDIYVHARKSKGLAMTLCFFLGWMGAHEFYLRKYLSGSLYLLFSWTFIPLLLSVIDFIIFLFTPKSVFHQMYDK
jgi:TM2 domain-containing membrane protein YozV